MCYTPDKSWKHSQVHYGSLAAGSDFIGWAYVYELGRRSKDNYYASIYANEGEGKTEKTGM